MWDPSAGLTGHLNTLLLRLRHTLLSGDWATLLLGHIIANLAGNRLTLLSRDLTTLLHWLRPTLLLRDSSAGLARNLAALVLYNLVTLVPCDGSAGLSRLVDTFLLRDQLTNPVWDSSAGLARNINTLLGWHHLALLSLNWPTLSPRDSDTLGNSLTLLSLHWSGHLPTLCAGYVPTLGRTASLGGTLITAQLPTRFLRDRPTARP